MEQSCLPVTHSFTTGRQTLPGCLPCFLETSTNPEPHWQENPLAVEWHSASGAQSEVEQALPTIEKIKSCNLQKARALSLIFKVSHLPKFLFNPGRELPYSKIIKNPKFQFYIYTNLIFAKISYLFDKLCLENAVYHWKHR